MDTTVPTVDTPRTISLVPQAPPSKKLELPHILKKKTISNNHSRGQYRGRGWRVRGRGTYQAPNDGHGSTDYHIRDRSPRDSYVRDRSPRDSYVRDRSPRDSYDNRGGHHYDQSYRNHTPVHTQNRFSPLRDT